MYQYQPAPDLLKQRVILVTGAGSGIGRVAARCFAEHGASVVLLGKTIRKLEAIYDEIEQAGLPQAAIYPLDLEGASPDDYTDLAQILAQEFGRLDGVLHNAVFMEGLTPIANYKPEIWYRALQVNLNAPFLLTQAVLGLLKKSTDATLVFTVDKASQQAYWGAYTVAKSAIERFAKLLASELQANTNIRVNMIDPGIVSTDLRLKTYPAGDQSQWAKPESILAAYLYLFGADSKAVNGQIIEAQS